MYSEITFRLWLSRLQLALKSILGSLYYLQHLTIGPSYPDCNKPTPGRRDIRHITQAGYEPNEKLPCAPDDSRSAVA